MIVRYVQPLTDEQRILLEKTGRIPLACGSFDNLKNRVKYPHFSTCMRGFCHGLPSLFLSVGADRPGVAVPHAPVGVAQRPRRRVPAAAGAHTPTAQTPPCAHTLCGPHHQAALRRLCIQQCPSPTDTLSPATPHRAHAGAPPPGRHLDTFLLKSELYVLRMGRMGQSPCQWPSQWRSLASAAV